MKVTNEETVGKVLSSAAELFSEFGYHGASVRDITRKAGVNLAAMHYHFGDKQELYRATIVRYLRPINETRLRNLASAGELAGGFPIPLALVIEIFARPVFELCDRHDPCSRHVLRLIGRSMLEPLSFLDEFLATELHPVTTRFSQAIRRHLPSLTPEEFMWRLNFVIGALHHTLGTLHRMKELTHGLCRDCSGEVALRHFIRFAEKSLVD